MTRAAELRQQIREADDTLPDWELRDLWNQAQSELQSIRLFGDLALAAFFGGQKAKEREGKRAEYANAILAGKAESYHAWIEECRHGDPPLAPFHWEIEFPEVFDRDNPGFDAMIGNPPFLAGRNVWPTLGGAYPDYLRQVHEDSGGKAVDLVAHFFRRAF